MQYYYLISFAYHLESTIDHLLARPKNDFYEMICHHVITCLLIIFSYTANWQTVGVVVMLVMDNADIFIGLIRTFMDLVPDWLAMLMWVGLMTSWVYSRIYVFSLDILANTFFNHRGYINR